MHLLSFFNASYWGPFCFLLVCMGFTVQVIDDIDVHAFDPEFLQKGFYAKKTNKQKNW